MTHILGKLTRRKDKLAKLKTREPRRVQGTTWPRGIKAKKGVAICPACNEIFYDKKWWGTEELRRHLLQRAELKNKSFISWLKSVSSYQLRCPEDRQRRDQWFEGIVTLQGITPSIKREVLNLVKNVGQYAGRHRKDVESEILKIEDQGETIIIYASENQLAMRIGKQVARAHKGGKLDIRFSHQDDAVRVYWQAP